MDVAVSSTGDVRVSAPSFVEQLSSCGHPVSLFMQMLQAERASGHTAEESVLDLLDGDEPYTVRASLMYRACERGDLTSSVCAGANPKRRRVRQDHGYGGRSRIRCLDLGGRSATAQPAQPASVSPHTGHVCTQRTGGAAHIDHRDGGPSHAACVSVAGDSTLRPGT
jgi:hypothetical protein